MYIGRLSKIGRGSPPPPRQTYIFLGEFQDKLSGSKHDPVVNSNSTFVQYLYQLNFPEQSDEFYRNILFMRLFSLNIIHHNYFWRNRIY